MFVFYDIYCMFYYSQGFNLYKLYIYIVGIVYFIIDIIIVFIDIFIFI